MPFTILSRIRFKKSYFSIAAKIVLNKVCPHCTALALSCVGDVISPRVLIPKLCLTYLVQQRARVRVYRQHHIIMLDTLGRLSSLTHSTTRTRCVKVPFGQKILDLFGLLTATNTNNVERLCHLQLQLGFLCLLLNVLHIYRAEIEYHYH